MKVRGCVKFRQNLVRREGSLDAESAKTCRKIAFQAQNRSMSYQIPSKSGPKMDGDGCLRGSGSLWGAPGEPLGVKMAPKSAKKRLKRGLDGHLDAFMGQLGSKMGSEIYGKLIKRIDAKIV